MLYRLGNFSREIEKISVGSCEKAERVVGEVFK